MGMGYTACHADTIESSFIEEICPDEFSKFTEFRKIVELENNISGDMADITDLLYDGADPEENSAHSSLIDAYLSLCESFEKKTGLTSLTLVIHDSNSSGDRYDDVDGEFWCVSGVLTYTKAGKKYKDKIIPVSWVEYA